MEEFYLYILLSSVISFFLIAVFVIRNKQRGDDDATTERGARPRRLPTIGEEGPAGGERAGPNRAAANRNARARMRVAQARRDVDENEDEDDEVENLGDAIALPDGKIGKKKQLKLAAKAEKRANREAEEREREERKERAEKLAEEKRKQERKEAKVEAEKEEEERREREEKEQREQEEYEKLRAQFAVEEEGFDVNADEEKERDLFNEFVGYIQREKVVVVEDLASKFNIKAQSVIDRIKDMQKEGTLTGVLDDRGKFIYISMEELEGVAKFIRQRGRISITELAESSSSLINLTPEANLVK